MLSKTEAVSKTGIHAPRLSFNYIKNHLYCKIHSPFYSIFLQKKLEAHIFRGAFHLQIQGIMNDTDLIQKIQCAPTGTHRKKYAAYDRGIMLLRSEAWTR